MCIRRSSCMQLFVVSSLTTRCPILCTMEKIPLIILIELFGLIQVEGLNVTLNNVSIPTDGSGGILITDININPNRDNNNDALICQSELSANDIELGNWYLHPSRQSTDSEDRILNPTKFDATPDRGWDRNRDIDSEGYRLVRLKRVSASAKEGVFTCDIPGDTSGPVSVEIYYPIYSVSAGFEVVSAGEDGTLQFRVWCTSTGGSLRAPNMLVTGPGGFVSHLNNIQAVGTKRRMGADKLYAATGTISGMSNGSEYQCSASNEEIWHRSDTVVLTDPKTSVFLELTTSISLSWILLSSSVVTSYEVVWRSDQCPDDVDEGSATITETSYIIEDLREGTRYTITVSAINSAGTSLSDSVTGETKERTPSAAPTSVRVYVVTSYKIIVVWGAVDCIHRNGDITGYSVQYGVVGSESTLTVSISEASVTKATVSTIKTHANYSIEVAAVNSAGTGVYSDPIFFQIPKGVFLSHRGNIIPNHGYVVISGIGSTGGTALTCHTNRPATLNNNTNSGGEWFAPNGTQIISDEVPGFRSNRIPKIVRLLRNTVTGTPSEGIYHCLIEDAAMTERTVYVGLYNSRRGFIKISNGMTFTVDSDLNGASPQFTLTCISTGGPATTVTWTRDSDTVTKGTETVLDDPVTAQYTHTLTVTGRLEGLYTCTVANTKPSQDSAQLNVQAPPPPSGVSVSQNGLTSVLVSWTPPSGEPAVTGYIIYYQQDGGERLSQSAGPTATTATFTGLMIGATYSFTMMSTSSTLPSTESAEEIVTIVTVPEQPCLSVTSLTATFISLSWSVPSDSVVTSSKVTWQETSSDASISVTVSEDHTSYIIEGLGSDTDYSVAVTISNGAGSATSSPILVSTSEECINSGGIAGGVLGAIICLSVSIIVVAIVVVFVVALVARQNHDKDKSTAPNNMDSNIDHENYVEMTQTGGSNDDGYEALPIPRVPPILSPLNQLLESSP